MPDQADIRLGVTHESLTADEATSVTVKAATDVIEAVKTRGIEAKNITTTFSVSAKYDSIVDPKTNVRNQVFRGYIAEEAIVVHITDVSKAGSIARELISKGANNFGGIDYSYSHEQEARRKLDGDAIRDARDVAKTYTDAIHLTLGRVLQIGGEVQGEGGLADLPSRSNQPRLHMAIPTEPGVQTLTESISVIWELEGKPQ